MKTKIKMTLIAILGLSVINWVPRASAQTIVWGPVTGITGPANLASGVYYDAFIPNTTASSALTVNGITFNIDTIPADGINTSDGIITVTGTSGSINNYNFNDFPSASPSSSDFAAVMNAGGVFQLSGAGAGTVTISGLTPGKKYQVQVFNYANDSDNGFTTLSGLNSVTIGNLPGLSGPNTYGQFATGIFTPTSSTETFNWTGAGSSYTVIGAIYVSEVPATDGIVWGSATGITGPANLASGVYFDAFIANTSGANLLTVNGITFNTNSVGSGNTTSDGKITAVGTSGSLNNYSFADFPTASPSSSDFAAVMNAGGIYQNGGAGAGTVTIAGLTPGTQYQVQVFNYANDGDNGFTTLGGSNSVTIGNLPGLSGPNTYGQFATGTFTPTSSTETFTWTGAGSGATVLGSIYVSGALTNLSPSVTMDTTPSSVTTFLDNSVTTLSATIVGGSPLTNQWMLSTNGGVTFSAVPGATGGTLAVTNSQAGSFQYYLNGSNPYGAVHSSPATYIVIPFSAAAISWQSNGITSDANLSTNGAYFDALMLNNQFGPLLVDGITFNKSLSQNSGYFGDGFINYIGIGSGLNNYSWTGYSGFTTNISADFATLLGDGGVYQVGGGGTGRIIVSGLTKDHVYQVQIFNFANDGDSGLTTFSGVVPATLNNLPAPDSSYFGSCATGTFQATGTAASFNWTGANAGNLYTVVGSISVRDVTVTLKSTLTNGMLQLSWPADHTGWRLQTQANPLSVGLGTNWVNLPNSNLTNQYSAPISTTNGNVFFRLVYP